MWMFLSPGLWEYGTNKPLLILAVQCRVLFDHVRNHREGFPLSARGKQEAIQTAPPATMQAVYKLHDSAGGKEEWRRNHHLTWPSLAWLHLHPEAQKRVHSHALFPCPPPSAKFISNLFYFPFQQAKGGLSGSVSCISFFISWRTRRTWLKLPCFHLEHVLRKHILNRL